MVKLIRREGKMVLPSSRADWSKSLAKRKIYKRYGKDITINFGTLRKDGTRSVKIKPKKGNDWSSWSYLTDIR